MQKRTAFCIHEHSEHLVHGCTITALTIMEPTYWAMSPMLGPPISFLRIACHACTNEGVTLLRMPFNRSLIVVFLLGSYKKGKDPNGSEIRRNDHEVHLPAEMHGRAGPRSVLNVYADGGEQTSFQAIIIPFGNYMEFHAFNAEWPSFIDIRKVTIGNIMPVEDHYLSASDGL